MSKIDPVYSRDEKSNQVFTVGGTSVEGESSTGFVDDVELQSFNKNDEKELHQGLKARHIQLIALGGAIGTGLFIGSGSSLAKCGPLGLLLGYMILSTVIYNVMNQLAEMICYIPLEGGAVSDLVKRYVDESLAFATGWIYYYTFVILVCAEDVATALIIQYWTEKVHVAVWLTIYLVVVIALNFLAVKYYGETEFWFASIKIFCIIGLIIVGIVIFFGGGPNQQGVQGFRYWKNPGPFVNHLDVKNANAGRVADVWTSVIKSGFAFIVSPEIVAVASGETQNPRRNISKAAKRFIYRVIFFYILGALVIGVVVPSNNDRLLSGSSNASASPFVIGIQNVGIKGLDHVINAAVLTSAWSAGNSFFYAASRFLHKMAQDGDAPKIFQRTNKHGVPYVSCALTAVISLLSYLNVSSTSANVFTWFSNICTISGFIGWVIIGICYLRWRKAVQFNGLIDRIPFKTPFQPYGAYFSITFISFLCLTNGYAVFIDFNAADFIAAYITLPVFAVLYFGHKLITRNWKWAYPVEEVDVITGLDRADEDEAKYKAAFVPPKNFGEKFLEWLL